MILKLFFLAAFMTSLLAEAQTAYLSTFHWSGCYVLRIPPGKTRKQIYKDLPRRFRLTLLPGDENYFMVQALDTKDRERWPFSSWQMQADDTVNVSWGTGFVGYEVLLTETGSRLQGTAQYYTDDGQKYSELKLDGRRIACPAIATQ